MNFTLKNIFLFLLLLSATGKTLAQKNLEIVSPNGRLKVIVNLSDKIYYAVKADDQELLSNNFCSLTLSDIKLGINPKLVSSKKSKHEEVLKPHLPIKFSTIHSTYNAILMKFKGDYSVEFRAYDTGIAYRFITDRKGEIEVMNEEFNVNFPSEYLLHLQQTGDFKTSSEEAYTHISSSDWKQTDKMSTLPILIDSKNKYKILISESDLSDYPGLFLQGTGENGARSTFPKAPLEFGPDGDRSQKITKSANYIAKTAGKRSFPWRYFLITDDDKQIIENTMTLELSQKSVIDDPTWIEPGQVSWEWWNDASPYGPDVNFVAGFNHETYKYYIDFASKFGVKYIIMDEGWAKDTTDPYTENKNILIQDLIKYGQQKNVGIILWLPWLTVQNHMELFKTYKEWGVKGVKIDFMDRSDQWMVNYYENVVKEAAENNILVNFHGSFKPAGLEYKYPNLVSYEAVRGLENLGGCSPDNSIYLPFIRNAVGPMDFTPGAMINMQPEVYHAHRPNAAGIGTRTNQLAMYVVFESALSMLCDNPTLYYRNLDCTEFITSVPTVWDETQALIANVGEIAVVAKRNGDKWFVGGMVNGHEDKRKVELNFDFLPQGKIYTMTYFEDGINAGRQAMDYVKKTKTVKSGDKMEITMVRNGGWAARLE